MSIEPLQCQTFSLPFNSPPYIEQCAKPCALFQKVKLRTVRHARDSANQVQVMLGTDEIDTFYLCIISTHNIELLN